MRFRRSGSGVYDFAEPILVAQSDVVLVGQGIVSDRLDQPPYFAEGLRRNGDRA